MDDLDLAAGLVFDRALDEAEARAAALARLADDDAELYATCGDGTLVELTAAGVALAESAGLRVDVDAYGCAYCVEAVEARVAEDVRRAEAGEPAL